MARLSILLLLCLFVTVSADEDDDDCEECSVQADSAIKTVKSMMQKIEPMTLADVSPCNQCYIYGIHTMVRNTSCPICSKKTDDGGYAHKFHVYFTNITVDCTCTLNANPTVLTSQLASSLQKTGSIKDCSPEKQAEAGESLKNSGMPTLTGPDMLKLSACKPPKTVSISTKSSYSGKIYATWKGLRISFISMVAPDTGLVNIKNIAILTKTFENLKVQCKGEKGFDSACNCLVATNFHTHLLVQAVYMILPCGIDSRATSYNELVQYFKCEQ